MKFYSIWVYYNELLSVRSSACASDDYISAGLHGTVVDWFRVSITHNRRRSDITSVVTCACHDNSLAGIWFRSHYVKEQDEVYGDVYVILF